MSAAGGASCWGENSFGGVGDGTIERRTTPVGVSGLSSGVASVDAGDLYHTCAVTTGGAAKCWGSNPFGELGNGTTSNATTAVDVTGLGSGVAAISAGGWHTCALTTAGGVQCWGRNAWGQLGDGTTTDSSVPVPVSGLASGVAAISSGLRHSCALTAGGGVKCWGMNEDGELGDGTTTSSPLPVDVTGLASGVAQIATGGDSAFGGSTGATCAVTGGGVKCWGKIGTQPFGNTPTDIAGLTTGASAVSVGARQATALTSAGGWTRFSTSTNGFPIVLLGSGMASVADGSSTCGLTTAGAIRCAFVNRTTVLGRGPVPSSLTGANCVFGFGDEDGDGLCDVYDSCTNFGGPGQLFAPKPKARAVVANSGLDRVAGDERLSLGVRFALPAGVAFADLDLIGLGTTIQLLNSDGLQGEVVLGPGAYGGPGTAGWEASPNGKIWRYVDATGTRPAVVVRGRITDRSNGVPGGPVDVKVEARGQTLPTSQERRNVMVTVILGDAAAGAAGRCAQSLWPLCQLQRSSKLVCG